MGLYKNREVTARANYFLFLVAFFFAGGFFTGFFFTTFFFFAVFVFFVMVFFFFAVAARAFFFGAAGPLLSIGSSQQITPAVAHPHSSSITTVSPHTSQLRTSPVFTFDICLSSSLLSGLDIYPTSIICFILIKKIIISSIDWMFLADFFEKHRQLTA
jgi:hypothetical protein